MDYSEKLHNESLRVMRKLDKKRIGTDSFRRYVSKNIARRHLEIQQWEEDRAFTPRIAPRSFRKACEYQKSLMRSFPALHFYRTNNPDPSPTWIGYDSFYTLDHGFVVVSERVYNLVKARYPNAGRDRDGGWVLFELPSFA